MHPLFSVAVRVGSGLIVGQLTHVLIAQRRAPRDTTARPFALIVALIGSSIGGTVGWSLRGDSGRVIVPLACALVGAAVLALIFHVITPV